MNHPSRNAENCEITVFMSLILLFIFALVGTLIDVTRGTVCQVQGRRILQSSGNALLTEYSAPLYERYHLFFLEDVGKSFEDSIAEYAGAQLHPSEGLFSVTDLYDMALNHILVEDKKYIGDSNASEFVKQMTACMKRQLAEDAAQTFLSKIKKTGDAKSQAEEIEETVETERENAKDSEKIYDLMKWVDGVDCSGNSVIGEKSFVKMFCMGTPTAEDYGITQAEVWAKVQENLIDVNSYFESIGSQPQIANDFWNQLEAAIQCCEQSLSLAEKFKPELVSLIQGNQNVFEQSLTVLQGEIGENTGTELAEIWKDYTTSIAASDYKGVGTEEGDNPLDTFENLLTDGIKDLVLPKDFKMSGKKTDNPDHYLNLHKINAKKVNSQEAIKNFANEEEVELSESVGDFSSISAKNVWSLLYLNHYFQHALSASKSKKWKTCLNYEMEYVLCGEKSDKENFEATINRIFLLRTVVNIGTIMATSTMRETCYGAALAVVGFTGLEPLIRLMQVLFSVMWGMAESLVDVAGVLSEREVPLVKKESDFQLTFPEIVMINHEFISQKAQKMKKAGKTSFGYEQYLMMMIATNKTETLHYRMMDLMEWNIRAQEVPGFQLGTCVDSFTVTGDFSYQMKFLALPGVANILERKIKELNASNQVTCSYLPE